MGVVGRRFSIFVPAIAVALGLWFLRDDFAHPEVMKMISEVQGEIIKVKGEEVHYILKGPKDGELVVMLHGISTAAFQLRTVYNVLAEKEYTTLAFDFYGRGHSTSNPQNVHNEQLFGNQTLDLLDALHEKGILSKAQIAKFDLIGYSMGGGVAVHVAAEFPERINSLTLIAAAGLTFPVPLSAKLINVPGIHFLFTHTPLGLYLLNKRAEGAFRSQGFGHYIEEFRTQNIFHILHKPDFMHSFRSSLDNFPLNGLKHQYEKVGKQVFPVLLIWGEDDKTVPFSCASIAKELIPHAKLLSLPNSGHVVHMERETEVNKAILEHIENSH